MVRETLLTTDNMESTHQISYFKSRHPKGGLSRPEEKRVKDLSKSEKSVSTSDNKEILTRLKMKSRSSLRCVSRIMRDEL